LGARPVSHHRNRQQFLPPCARANAAVFSGLVAPVVGLRVQALARSSSSFRSQAMHPPPPAQGPPSKGRDWRGSKDGGKMKAALTIHELTRLTRSEVCHVASRITTELPSLPEDSPERGNVLTTLCNIRYVLGRRDFTPP
jgi:hypothetical protein